MQRSVMAVYIAASCMSCTHKSARTAIRSYTPLIRLLARRSPQLASKQTAYNQRKNCRITQQQRLITASSKRQPKDPKKYATMDELRTHLIQQQGTGGFSGFLSWVGSTAFGASSTDGSPTTLATAYRKLLRTSWAQSLTSGLSLRPGYVASKADKLSNTQDATAHLGANQQQLQRLAYLLLCSDQCVQRMAQKCPEIPDMDPADVTERLMLLKQVFPDCDVIRMVELLPEGFLAQPVNSMMNRVAAINGILRGSLPGANIDMMVQEDPTILFENKESLSVGLQELHDLWDVDETCLRDSNPWEIALAIRTMSESEHPQSKS